MKKSMMPLFSEKTRSCKRVKPTLLALAISQALLLQGALAASIEVTSNLDDGTDCTLREALATINAGTDQFNGCALSGDALGSKDTITFDPTVSGDTITVTQGELSIANNVSINPGGVNTVILGGPESAVMTIETAYTARNVKLNQLAISGGITGIIVDFQYGSTNGNENLTLTNSTVSGSSGDGIVVAYRAGAALTDSTVSGNNGGGIRVDYLSNVMLTNSTVSGNKEDGVLARSYGSISLANSTVSGNKGNGIALGLSQAFLDNSTVVDNNGGGIDVGSHSNISLSNSIVANPGVENCLLDLYGASINAGTDTISSSGCGGATIADPLLGPLADNGGPTQTHALLPGSPAIDNGTAAGATAADQRGIAAEGVRDSGAYEFIASINAITIDKLINNEARESADDAAQLLAGSLYRQVYEVTNTSPDRLYQVRVYEGGNQVCNLYTLDAGETKQSCNTVETVLEGDQHVEITVNAKISGTSDSVSATTDSYYSGVINGQGEMAVTHYADNRNSDTPGQAQSLSSSQTNVLFKVENTGDIELYRVKTYHDPVSPVNSGWAQQCVMGPLKPGQVRYCKRDITLSDTGLNHAMGRVQGANAFSSPTSVINAANPTYFIVP